MSLNAIVLASTALAAGITCGIIPTLLAVGHVMPSPALRRAWRTRAFTMTLCLGFFVAYAAMKWGATSDVSDVVVASLMPIGALSLFEMALLSRRTARDILRVTALEAAAFADPLTGLGNRRLFEQRLAEAIRHAAAAGLPLSLIVLDIDHFKRVNDAHGHGVGDLVLKQVATLVAAKCRPSDTACRIGGEEFVVIVPGLDGAFLAASAERLRRAVAETGVPLEGGGEVRATVSLGLATLRPRETADLLFRRADAALYGAKRGGRDRVSLAA